MSIWSEGMNKMMGVFETMEEAIEAARVAQTSYEANYTLADRERIIQVVKKSFVENAELISKMELEETGYGVYEHKVMKNTGAPMGTPGIECLPNKAYINSDGVTVEECAPYGVVGALTPVTNPNATVASNGIAMLASGNAIVFNCHPAAKGIGAFSVNLFNSAVVEAGGPENLITMIKDPTMESLDVIMKSPTIQIVIGTGGPAMVETIMKCGKKVFAAGPGNPPVIVDETADISKAATAIMMGASFDNNILCLAEKEVFVVESVADQFIEEMQKVGCYLLNAEETKKVTELIIPQDETGKYAVNKKWVGQDANKILEAATGKTIGSVPLLILESDADGLFVQKEQLTPVLPIVRVKNFEEAIDKAIQAEHGFRHSAAIWTNNLERATIFGKAIKTTLYAQNGTTMAPQGVGGAGTNGPTIATTTGEGVVDGGHFTRRMRFAMAGGLGYIV
jgi:propionaldehyde dehydrogenase